MKKFIAAFDGLDFSKSTMNYSIFLAKNCSAHLVGVFLDDFMRHSYGLANIKNYEGSDLDRYLQQLNEKDKEERNESVEIFENACQNEGINYSVHRDKNVAIQELLHESIYADLLIISESETLTLNEEPTPSRFIRNLLLLYAPSTIIGSFLSRSRYLMISSSALPFNTMYSALG